MSYFVAEQGVRLHHLHLPDLPGQGLVPPLARPERQEDRPQARDSQVKKQGQQNQEDLRGRSQSGDVCR